MGIFYGTVVAFSYGTAYSTVISTVSASASSKSLYSYGNALIDLSRLFRPVNRGVRIGPLRKLAPKQN